MNYTSCSVRGIKNAEFILREVAQCREGEVVAIIIDDYVAAGGKLLALCAKKLGLRPFCLDLSVYGTMNFSEFDYRFIPQLKDVLLASDIVLTGINIDILLNDQILADKMIAGYHRFYRVYNMQSLNEVDYDYAGIMADRRRTPLLRTLVENSSVMHITTAKGTDLTCNIGKANLAAITDILGLLPFFSEVATVPNYGTVNGTVVADGAVQKLRFNQFGMREISGDPIRLTIKNSKVVDIIAPSEQLARIRKFIDTPNPPADKIDEVGLVTATTPLNDYYQWRVWGDGTHHSKSVHVALGNNYENRADLIHASSHADFDIYDPQIEIDGTVICHNGTFDDQAIERRLSELPPVSSCSPD
ncbi:MAG: aminopeptidase [Victivallales bacterium]|nr:aminopeptidase [Victivallales bacterium]